MLRTSKLRLPPRRRPSIAALLRQGVGACGDDTGGSLDADPDEVNLPDSGSVLPGDLDVYDVPDVRDLPDAACVAPPVSPAPITLERASGDTLTGAVADEITHLIASSAHNDRWYGTRRTGVFGTVLRIDPKTPDTDAGTAYSIPADNPFVDGGGAPEVWAFGLRNPWRLAFDSETGDLYVGDVGQDTWEEANRIVRGGSYGWSAREGDDCFDEDPCDDPDCIDPVWAYTHAEGASITLGPVHRGDAVPELVNERGEETLERLIAEVDPMPDLYGDGPLDERARAYVHATCAGCHRPGGPSAQSDIDLRFHTPMAERNLCGEEPTQGYLYRPDSDQLDLLIPGDPGHSILWLRMETTDLFRMPALGTGVPDEDALDLVGQRITEMEDCP